MTLNKREGKEIKKRWKFLLILIPIVIYLLLASFLANLGAIPEKEKHLYMHESGYVYPYSVDSFSYYKQASSLTEGKPVDKHSLLIYVEYAVFKVGRIFDADFSLVGAIYYTPLIFGIISIILIFLVTRKATNEIAGFIASVLFAIHPLMLKVFQAGYGDDASISMALSLLFTLFLFEAIDSFSSKLKKRAIIFSALCLASVALLWFAWSGYYYILAITFVFLLIYIPLRLYQKKERKKLLMFLIAVGALIVIALLMHNFIATSRIYIRIFTPEVTEGYYDTASNIQELRNSNFKMILSFAGGWWFLISALIGLAGFLAKTRLFSNHDKKTAFKLFIAVYAVMALLGTIFAIKANTFFALFLIILCSAGIFYLSEFIAGFRKSWDKPVATLLTALLILAVFVGFNISFAYKIVNQPPLMEDSVYVTAQKINQHSEPDAIVTSWWDEGHFYYAFSGRNVTVKAHPKPVQMHLISKALATNDENLSIEIFRLLNCGELDKEKIKENLSKVLAENHCVPKQNFLVLSSWMQKYYDSIYWNGNWNFEKQKTDFDSSSRPMGDFEACTPREDIFKCGNYTVNRTSWEAFYNGKSLSLIYPRNDSIFFKDKKTKYVLVLYEVGSKYESAAVRRDLIDTVFVRLYFFKGMGLSNFKKFTDVVALKRTLTYELVWK